MNVLLHRRGFLKGALALGAVGSLGACTGDGKKNTTSDGNAGQKSSESTDSPFGMAKGSKVEAVIFNGGYGISYAQFAGQVMEKKHKGTQVEVKGSNAISQEMRPRFTGGNPPDVIDNAGAGKMGLVDILPQLEDLNDLVDAPNYEGKTIRDTLYPGVVEAGTVDDTLAELNYVLTVYSLWYSKSLFEENSWQPPKTWDEALELGAKAKDKGKYLFVWGNEASDYYLEMAITSAIKEGGHDVRIALDNLVENCWRHEAIQNVFTKLKECVDKGYFKPGGAGTQFTAAQAQWSNDQEALLYPAGGWIENEMKDQTKTNFKMTGVPVPTITTSPKLPFDSLHCAATEAFIVPSKGANVAGGKEFMRCMLSRDAATNFAKQILSPSVVINTVPEDAFGSTALKSQLEMLKNAGDNRFNWRFNRYYGMGTNHVVACNSFLNGKMSVDQFTDTLQTTTDRIRREPSIEKYEVK